MRTVTYNLIQFLTEARRGAFVIPRFQRPFVWNHAQVKLLIDSISRNYPIGSLLLLQETIPTEPFLSSRPIDAVIGESDGDDSERDDSPQPAFPPAVYYVLDGQQRLTSLVRVFLQASKESVYYFDLDKLLETDAGDRNASAWVVRRNAGRKLPVRYMRSDAIADDERCVVLAQEYFESSHEPLKGDRPAQRKAVAKVNRVFETMRNYQIPLVIVDRGDSTEAICRIFETINSTGTRLTTFDLAVARFFPRPDLHDLWQQSKAKHSVLERFSAEGERVLQIVAILSGYEQRSYVEPTRGTLLNLTGQDILNRWDDCAEALAQTLDWVEAHGAVPGLLSNDALLVPLAYTTQAFLRSACTRSRRASSVSAGSRGSAPAVLASCSACTNFPRNTFDNACTGNRKRRERLGTTQLPAPPAPGCNAPQAISACTCRWRRSSCVQVCSTRVKAPMPPSQRGLAANSPSVAAAHCISVS